MERQAVRTAHAAIGAVIGAGFATGRELNVFFACHGPCGMAGALSAAAVIVWVASGEMRGEGKARRPVLRLMWRICYVPMLAALGGAMLACAGELAARLLPVRHAQPLGMVLMLAAACRSQERAASRAGELLTGCLTAMLLTGLLLNGEGTAVQADSGLLPALTDGLRYGGLNAAAVIPAAAQASGMTEGMRRQCVMLLAVLLSGVLLLGCTVMLRHPELRHETLPLLVMLRQTGRIGYALCSLTMELAVFTTLRACICGLRSELPQGRSLAPAAVLAASAFGFDGLIEQVYPPLGGACMLLLVLRKVAQNG